LSGQVISKLLQNIVDNFVLTTCINFNLNFQTIIEGLKYITTGDVPPGAKGAFVHDPKVIIAASVTLIKSFSYNFDSSSFPNNLTGSNVCRILSCLNSKQSRVFFCRYE
jgi:hypothetical protein